MEFTFESVNDALYNHHPELSGCWVFLGWEGDTATATYIFDNQQHEVIIRRDGTVEASDAVIQEMNKYVYAPAPWEMEKQACN